MTTFIKRAAFWVWPPVEVWSVDKEIDKTQGSNADARWESILNTTRASLPKDANNVELEALAKQIQDSEAKRKDILENKASIFVSGIGIALTIASLASAVLIDKQVPPAWAVTLAIAYLLSIVCLLTAAYYSTKARRVAAFATLSADAFLFMMQDDRWRVTERIVFAISQTKWNESLLLKKSNYLSVAESLFLRGLLLITLTVTASVIIRLSGFA
jgi:hypothetical protein